MSGENFVPMLGVSEIVRAVSQATGISVRAIMSRRRRRDVAQARMLCMYLARLLTPLSSPAIGECMGRDHSTILSGAREIRYLRQRAQDFGDVRYRGLDGIAARLIDELSEDAARDRAALRRAHLESLRMVDNAVARLMPR